GAGGGEAGGRGEQQRTGPADQERLADAAQRLGAILARDTGDEDLSADRHREQARGLVEAGHRRPVHEQLAVASKPELRSADQAAPRQRWGRVQYPAARGEELRERFAGL